MFPRRTAYQRQVGSSCVRSVSMLTRGLRLEQMCVALLSPSVVLVAWRWLCIAENMGD